MTRTKTAPPQRIKSKRATKIAKVIKPVPPEVPAVAVKKKKASARMYFTPETQAAIVTYNANENMEIRERIYRDQIEFPLQKLVENVFNRFGFSYFDTSPHEVQREALAHLVSQLGKFDPNRPSKKPGKKKKNKNKAFAYFSVIAKNWFILLNNNNYKKYQTHVEISEERGENTVQLQHVDKHHAQKEPDEFMRLTIEFWEENVGKIFQKKRDLDIANAVIELLRNSRRIEAFNKKALYLNIRDMSDCKTQQITKVINKMKQYHRNIYRTYLNDGVVSKTVHLS